MRTDGGRAARHREKEDVDLLDPEPARKAAADRDLRRERWERLGARIMWAVNLFGLIMLLVVFMKLDGLF